VRKRRPKSYPLMRKPRHVLREECLADNAFVNLVPFGFSQHALWESGTNWKSALNNLRLIIQPLIFWYLIQPWLRVFSIPGLKRGLFKLIEIMNDFRASPIKYAMAS